MPGPDPAVAALRHAVRQALAGHAIPGEPATVACSGGADSLALAAALAFEGPRAGHPVAAVTVDHGLQPGSAGRAADTAALLRGLGFPSVEVRTVTVAPSGGGGPENRARTARYAALRPTAGWVLLGHSLDDQAETVLLGLGRGSGPRSVAGMPRAARPWLRPLLDLPRALTRAACAAEGLPVWDDPHNTDPAFTRVRLRREVLPLLEEVLRGGVAEALARTADLLREDLETLDALAAAVPVEHAPRVAALADLPAGLRRRVLRRWLAPAGALSSAQLRAVDALLTDWHGQGAVSLPGGFRVARRDAVLRLEDAPEQERRGPTGRSGTTGPPDPPGVP